MFLMVRFSFKEPDLHLAREPTVRITFNHLHINVLRLQPITCTAWHGRNCVGIMIEQSEVRISSEACVKRKGVQSPSGQVWKNRHIYN